MKEKTFFFWSAVWGGFWEKHMYKGTQRVRRFEKSRLTAMPMYIVAAATMTQYPWKGSSSLVGDAVTNRIARLMSRGWAKRKTMTEIRGRIAERNGARRHRKSVLGKVVLLSGFSASLSGTKMGTNNQGLERLGAWKVAGILTSLAPGTQDGPSQGLRGRIIVENWDVILTQRLSVASGEDGVDP